MKGLKTADREQLRQFFSANLQPVDSQRARDYMLGVLMKYVDGADFEKVFSERPISLIADDLWRNPNRSAAYEGFRGIGDAMLILCGLFPHRLSKYRRKRGTHEVMSPGLGWYVDKGRDSYNAALHISNEMRLGGDITSALSIMSEGFEQYSRAILEMRVRMNEGACISDPYVASEVSAVLYHGGDAAARLAEIAGKERPALSIVDD